MGENAYFFGRKNSFGLAPMEFPASAVIWEGEKDRPVNEIVEHCLKGAINTASTSTACQMFEHFQSSKHLPNRRSLFTKMTVWKTYKQETSKKIPHLDDVVCHAVHTETLHGSLQAP